MSSGARGLIVAVALVLSLAPLSVTAQPPKLEGRYILDARASDDVHKAIDEAVAEMSGLRRPFARLRLREVNQPPQRIDVVFVIDSLLFNVRDVRTVRI